MKQLLNFKLFFKIVSIFWIVSGSLSFILPSFAGETITTSTFQRLSLYISFTSLLTSMLFFVQKLIFEYSISIRVVSYIILSSLFSLLHMYGYYEIKIIFGFEVTPISQQFVFGYIFGLGFRYLILFTLIELILKEKLDRLVKIKQLKLEKENIDSKLNYLTIQLNPHFMFNTLNSISSLIETEPTKANESLELFANVYRSILDTSNNNKTTLNKELRFTRNYLELMKLRYGGRLNVIENIHVNTEVTIVPPVILQPILENSFIHGFKNKIDECKISILISIEKENLVVILEDNGVFIPNDVNGIGLSNIKNRLKLLYNERFLFEQTNNLNGTKTRIEIPYENTNS